MFVIQLYYFIEYVQGNHRTSIEVVTLPASEVIESQLVGSGYDQNQVLLFIVFGK